MTMKTISKEMKKIDDENYEIVESRESTTMVNGKMLIKQIANFKKDLKNKINQFMKDETLIVNSIKTYNGFWKEIEEANDLWFTFEIPTEVTLESLKDEINEEIGAAKESLSKD